MNGRFYYGIKTGLNEAFVVDRATRDNLIAEHVSSAELLNDVKTEYDPKTDTLTITLREARIRESDEVRPGVIADFGYDGGVVRFEVLEASKVVDETREMQFALAGE